MQYAQLYIRYGSKIICQNKIYLHTVVTTKMAILKIPQRRYRQEKRKQKQKWNNNCSNMNISWNVYNKVSNKLVEL